MAENKLKASPFGYATANTASQGRVRWRWPVGKQTTDGLGIQKAKA